MKKGGQGGANTLTGLVFEQKTDLKSALLSVKGVRIEGTDVYRGNIQVGKLLQKHSLYTDFLDENDVTWQEILSKKLLPDEAYLDLTSKRLIIVEKKFQTVAGSVDEKLQTCGFKRRQYMRLCAPIKNLKVHYVYVLNDWFMHSSYSDVLEYIKEVNCDYFFNELPLALLGLD